MKLVLHLTPAEFESFCTVPRAARDGWAVTPETLLSYESEAELEMRRGLFRQSDPQYRDLLDRLHSLDASDFDAATEAVGEIPRELLTDMLFTLGARFLDGYIGVLLGAAATPADIEGVALISMYRHSLLEANAEHSHAAS